PRRAVPATRAAVQAVAAREVETVAGNGSVGCLHPLDPARARAFWEASLREVEQGGRIVLCAWREGTLLGTGSLVLVSAPSQPHRAELTKVMTSHAARGAGVGAALVAALADADRKSV